MTTLKLTEQTFIPAGLKLEATIVDVKKVPTPFWVDDNDHSKGKKDQISFRFKIIEGEYENRNLFGQTSTFYSNQSKLGAWVREILATDSLPEDLELEALIDLPVCVIVGHKTKEVNGMLEVAGERVDQVVRVISEGLYTADSTF